VEIRLDDLRGAEIADLLTEHRRGMHSITPPGSVHALGLDALRDPAVTVWTAWDDADLLGCGALKALSPREGEVKSMRTASTHLRKGVAAALLQHIIGEAKRRAYRRLFLETGASAPFEPAHRLYERFGFARCGPFVGYVDDPNSVFMSTSLDDAFADRSRR
jgi:putative acetyltransferase